MAILRQNDLKTLSSLVLLIFLAKEKKTAGFVTERSA